MAALAVAMSDNLSMDFADLVIPYAHAGHWLAGLLYLVPVFILAGGILWQRKQDAKRGREDPTE